MNKVTVSIPGALRDFTGGASELQITAPTVGAALAAIGERHPAFLSRVLTPEGELRPNVNIFLDRDSVKTLEGLGTPLKAGAALTIVPAVAGG
jgi:molybdopterin converting factor small subunit